ncbi:MAG: glycosyltransferase family 4 protein [Leptospira sp.]|nr:glycosyltransferase family 4 protein [Leptospira sp.]
MILGIDASNIRGGGGVTHLVELLRAAEPKKFDFEKVIVWGGSETLAKLDEKPWLKKEAVSFLDKSLFHRIFWQKFKLSEVSTKSKCNLLFIPGGSFSGKFIPFVTMNQNLLPFELKEILRYGFSKETLRLFLLRIIQSRTFGRADGIIFLTNYARKKVLDQFSINISKTTIINHGINLKFFNAPRVQRSYSDFISESPSKILYVSFIGEYKHQWKVVEAMSILKKENIPLELILVGDLIEKSASKKLQNSIQVSDKTGLIVRHYEKISYEDIQKLYLQADLFIFASSCETFGQILTEAMASGLPIVCSSLSAMPELLGKSGVYFNPENSDEIAQKVKNLIENKELRRKLSQDAFEQSKNFSWEKCANETFHFFYSTVYSQKK